MLGREAALGGVHDPWGRFTFVPPRGGGGVSRSWPWPRHGRALLPRAARVPGWLVGSVAPLGRGGWMVGIYSSSN